MPAELGLITNNGKSHDHGAPAARAGVHSRHPTKIRQVANRKVVNSDKTPAQNISSLTGGGASKNLRSSIRVFILSGSERLPTPQPSLR
jgi:hypothetical protein